jgi:hypothetical protein
MQAPGLMLLRVSAYWGSNYPFLNKGLITIYILCTMGTASLQMLAVSKFYRRFSSRILPANTESSSPASNYTYSPYINCCATVPPKIAVHLIPSLYLRSANQLFPGRVLCTIPLNGERTICFNVLEMVHRTAIASSSNVHHPHFLPRWINLFCGYFLCV